MVVNTHPDVDHWWGNAALPGAEVVASAAAATAMRAEPTPQRLLAQRSLSKLTGHLPGRLGGGGRYMARSSPRLRSTRSTLRFPDRTFTGRRTETVGGRTVGWSDHGAAHTASDSVVFVPDARVAFAGDLLFAAVTPIMWHGPVAGWLAALGPLVALEADMFVPGHGPVAGRDELQALRGYWAWLRHEVAQDRAAGRSPLEIAKRMPRARVRAFRDWETPSACTSTSRPSTACCAARARSPPTRSHAPMHSTASPGSAGTCATAR